MTLSAEAPAVPESRREPRERRPREAGPRRAGPRRELRAFLAVAVLALVVMTAGTVVVSERIAQRGALAEAEDSAERISEFLVMPILTEALQGLPGRWEELRRRVEDRMSDETIDSIFVWTGDGEILFSSHESLEGQRSEPSAELLAAVGGDVVAAVEEEPEGFHAGTGAPAPTLEVYVPAVAGTERLAVEVYFPYSTIERQAALARSEILPLAVGAMLLLQVVQIPIAVKLVRRVRRHELAWADMVARSLAASEQERRTIAGDVHDGPVQDLAGVTLALSSLGRRLPASDQALVDRLVDVLRDAIRSLRRLIIDIYPPDLSGRGLGAAVTVLATPLQEDGVEVHVHAVPLGDVDPSAAAVVYRTAKEALTNIARHAAASRVDVRLEPATLLRHPAVRLEVTDDGVGLPPAPRTDGDASLGLRLVRDRVEGAGGTVSLGPGRAGGTTLVAIVPANPPC